MASGGCSVEGATSELGGGVVGTGVGVTDAVSVGATFAAGSSVLTSVGAGVGAITAVADSGTTAVA